MGPTGTYGNKWQFTFIADNGFAKLVIALAKGKKEYDKRQSIKDKDLRREMDRNGY